MNRTSLVLASAFVAVFAHGTALSQDAGTLRVVLKGHDPVAYFTDGKPVKGDPKISYDWDEGRYYFANARNRSMFAGDPERYAPQFGGYCTGSMSRGVRNEGDPEGWVISDGKLYVFGAAKFKALAENDPEYLAVRIPKAQQNYRTKQ
ncbi:MAG: YHS domain-containing (seleno)protein [Burkholderiales bacterium]